MLTLVPPRRLRQRRRLRNAGGVPNAEEFLGPFTSWHNVKTAYSAAGNESTDDHPALQNACDDVGAMSGVHTLYFPAGTYRITEPLVIHARQHIRFVGEDPATTRILWDGVAPEEEGSVMIWLEGVAYSSVSRLTWDGGSGGAWASVYQAYDRDDGTINYFDTGNEFQDCVFANVERGIDGGIIGFGFAETTVRRCYFDQCSVAGISLGNANALDLWAWDCTFDGCATGIRNNTTGGFHAYQCLFLGSTTADLQATNIDQYSVRDCVSIGSARFIDFWGTNNPSCTVIQGNRVIDCDVVQAIRVRNQGPLVLLDNAVRSLEAHTTGPVVYHDEADSIDTIAVGNTFTVTSPIQSGDRLIEIDTAVVSRSTIDGSTPTMPSTPRSMNRTVYTVTSGASASTIQTAINNAVSTGNRSVVHLEDGAYDIDTTLTIPANAQIHFVGDGYGVTVMTWDGEGTGPIIHVLGPNKSWISDFGVYGDPDQDGDPEGNGILIEDVDQVGARVYMTQMELRQSTVANLHVDGLDHCLVDIRNLGSGNIQVSGVGVKVTGGTLANAGTPAGGRTVIACGLQFTSQLAIELVNGGQLVYRDVWYETPEAQYAYATLTKGAVTIEGCRISTPTEGSPAAIAAAGFNGAALVVATKFDDRIAVSGSGSNATVAALGVQGGNADDGPDPFFVDTSSPAATVSVQNSRMSLTPSGSTAVSNSGTSTEAFIRSLFAQTRAEHPGPLAETPAEVTDLRLARIVIDRCLTGIRLIP